MSIEDVRGSIHALADRVDNIPDAYMNLTRDGLMEIRRTLAELSASTSEIAGRVGGFDQTVSEVANTGNVSSRALTDEAAALRNLTRKSRQQVFDGLATQLNMMAHGVIMTEHLGAYSAKVGEVAGALATAAAALESLETMAGRDVTANERQQAVVTRIADEIHTAADTAW